MSDEKVAGDAVDAVTEEDQKQPENADIFLSFTQAFVKSDHEKVSELLPSVEDFAPDLSTLCDRDGTSLFAYACWNGWLDIATELAEDHGCNPKQQNWFDEAPIHLASTMGHLDVVKYLVCELHCNSTVQNSSGFIPVHLACQFGHLNVVKFLICEQHSDPSCLSNKSNMPLHLACDNGHLDVVKFLISEQHCDPECKNKFDDTPLLLACGGGHLPIVKYLITEHKCLPSRTEERMGGNCLHHACSTGHLEVVKYFVSEQGMNPNRSTCTPGYGADRANTPLHLASENGHTEIVQFLLSTGRVDSQIQNREGKTALETAAADRGSKKEVLKVFQEFSNRT